MLGDTERIADLILYGLFILGAMFQIPVVCDISKSMVIAISLFMIWVMAHNIKAKILIRGIIIN